MFKKVTKEYIQSLIYLYQTKNISQLSIDQYEDILTEINQYITHDELLTIQGKQIPKNTLYIFNLIDNYYSAYILSKDESRTQRLNTLESLGKGNVKRKQRYLNNKEILKNDNSNSSEKTIAYFENIFLKLIIKGNYKVAYLLLGMVFMYKDSFKNLGFLFQFSKELQNTLSDLGQVIDLYSFTYLSSSKIVNSLTILLYIYLIEVCKLDNRKSLKFIRYIITKYFSETTAPYTIRESFLTERKYYCAGIYNNLPIFQWNTSTKNDSYYLKKDIRRVKKYIRLLQNDSQDFNQGVFNYLTKKLSQNEKEQLTKLDDDFIIKMIDHLPKTYLSTEHIRLSKKLQLKPKKTILYYLTVPIRLILTIFVALYIKFTLFKSRH